MSIPTFDGDTDAEMSADACASFSSYVTMSTLFALPQEQLEGLPSLGSCPSSPSGDPFYVVPLPSTKEERGIVARVLDLLS